MNTEENRLTQIGEPNRVYLTPNSKQKSTVALYRCSCGTEKELCMNSVNKSTKSCGCLKVEKNSSHGLSRNVLYQKWRDMINRCTNPNLENYKDYGERGITVCERWLKLENFIEDMYPTFEEGFTLDRINVDGNYELKNCRWSTQSTQMRNTRKLRKNNTSGYRGVSFHKLKNKWISNIVDGKHVHLGYFIDSIEAAKAYDTYVITHNLEHTINGVLFSELPQKENK